MRKWKYLRRTGPLQLGKNSKRDKEWADLVYRGLPWQILSWEVMLEEGAAVTISNALNIKNSSGMEVGTNEIFRYMHDFTNPSPQPTPFDPILEKLIGEYGSMAQDQHLHQAFQYILGAGGRNSLHLTDYFKFLDLY